MRASKDAGFDGWEGSLPTDQAGLDALSQDLSASGLSIRSLYANAPLHNAECAGQVADLVARCQRAKTLGLKILVLNPEPIDWSQPLEKDDAQLARQREALGQLDKLLSAAGVTLAYHIHDSELRSNAREMLAMTEGLPQLKLCMEAEWLARGGWSDAQIQVFMRAHAHRIVTTHLRQNNAGQPDLELGPGVIDHAALAATLKQADFDGPLVFEGYQTERLELSEMVEVLKRSVRWVRGVF